MWQYNQTQNSDELYHYGVIGMRWGIHRARKNGSSYTYKSHGQKKYERKLTKLQSSKNPSANTVKRTQNKLETYKKRDLNRQKYAENTTVGKSIVKGLLMGPFGSGNYNRLRAAGHTRLYSAGVSNIVASTLSLPYQVLRSRDDEFTAAR